MQVFISHFNNLAVRAIDSYQIMSAPNITLLFGPSGSGKTFLLNYLYQKTNNSEVNVTLVNAVTFAKEYAYTAYENNFTSFRQRYRSVDLLIIDDFHFLNGKVKTIEELFYTCESITAKKGKLIIALDGNTSNLSFLNERFRSRLLSGGQISIEEPTEEEVIRYLQHYLKNKSIHIDDRIIIGIGHNFPDLKKAIFHIDRFLVYCLSKNLLLDFNNFQIYLEEEYRQGFLKKDPKNILNFISSMSGIKVTDILSKKRSSEILRARQLSIYTIKKYCDLSYPQIAKIFGRNHSVIINTCQQLETKIRFDDNLKAQFTAINNYFNKNE